MNNQKVILWIIGAVVLVGLGTLLFTPKGGAGVVNVGDAKMQELVAQGVRVIDVRTSGEYEAGHIPGAENVPVNEFAQAAATWDLTQPVAVYCATGSRSASAVQTLEQLNFSQIYHLDAGMIAWTGEVERGTAVAAAPVVPATALDSPMLYEFYTDW